MNERAGMLKTQNGLLLDGIVVTGLSHVYNGSYASVLLAGAQVIKVASSNQFFGAGLGVEHKRWPDCALKA